MATAQTAPAVSAARPRRAWSRSRRLAELISGKRPWRWRHWKVAVPVSLTLHVVLLLALSLLVFRLPDERSLDSILSLVFGRDEGLAESVAVETVEPVLDGKDQQTAPMPFDVPLLDIAPEPPSIAVEVAGLTDFSRGRNPEPPSAKSESAAKAAAKVSMAPAGEGTDAPQMENPFAGRTPAAKAALLQQQGGTPASEAAVVLGLEWLKRHQRRDGSWSFDHTHSPDCDCTMPGQMALCPNGATAMALLCYLGAGHTHREGGYQPEVQRGLDFLLSHGSPAPKGINFYSEPLGQGNFYTHALVTIALSEALAMTSDETLRPAVEGAVAFISANQHSGGGWRYIPGQPGDTSVVAWQVMAVKSAQFSRITVPVKVVRNANRFLSSAQVDGPSRYGYLPGRGATPSMTAAGLLCRMYLGWRSNAEGLKSGTRLLSEIGPSHDDMYYNYYATQVLHHWGGPEWERWNAVLRDWLVASQIHRTHADGSWDVADRHGGAGGRLYMTALCILTLEVYYRHLPLYQRDRIELPLTGNPQEAAAELP